MRTNFCEIKMFLCKLHQFTYKSFHAQFTQIFFRFLFKNDDHWTSLFSASLPFYQPRNCIFSTFFFLEMEYRLPSLGQISSQSSMILGPARHLYTTCLITNFSSQRLVIKYWINLAYKVQQKTYGSFVRSASVLRFYACRTVSFTHMLLFEILCNY